MVMVMDEKVPETFSGPGDPVEQLMYGVSLIVCLPDGLSHAGSVGTGTVMRPGHPARLRPGRGFRRPGRAPDRARDVPLLPAGGLTSVDGLVNGR